MYQKTIENSFELSGIGLHTGKNSTIKVFPAKENSGIVFYRTDLPNKPSIPANYSKVTSTLRSTTLGENSIQIATVEHFLAALYGLGIDNLKIELNGEELPALDGSALIFTQALQNAGIVMQNILKKEYLIKEPLIIHEDDAYLIVLPDNKLKITYIIQFPHSLVGTQWFSFKLNKQTFINDIAPSRTFGFLEEIQTLFEKKLALGGNLENAILIKPDGYSSPLRFSNELVRHKCLDLLGDLALTGLILKAHIIVIKGNHTLNIKFIHNLLS